MQTHCFKYFLITLGITAILFGCSSSASEGTEIGNSFLTSHSPNQVHTIDLQEMAIERFDRKDNEVYYNYAGFRIYYGEYGSILEKYKQLKGFDLSTIDNFVVNWQDDNVVLIDVYRKFDDGTSFKDETIRLDTSN